MKIKTWIPAAQQLCDVKQKNHSEGTSDILELPRITKKQLKKGSDQELTWRAGRDEMAKEKKACKTTHLSTNTKSAFKKHFFKANAMAKVSYIKINILQKLQIYKRY